MMEPRFSVVVCTCNRSVSLARTLESLAALSAPEFTYEIVVVDNNSRDETKATVERFQLRFRQLTYVFEGRQGLSHARNTGVAHAQGQIVAFTDDDVRPETDWLVAMQEAFIRFRADCVYGKVLPEWDGERPPWLGEYFFGRLALVDRGQTPFLVRDERQEFYGANFAVTKEALAAIGPFNLALGRCGERLGGGEDVEYFNRLFRAGRRIAYQPTVVHHWVPRDRMTLAYFRRWHFQHGESSAHLEQPRPRRGLLGIPFWAMRNCLGHLLGWVLGLVLGRAEQRLMHEMRLIFYLGLFSQQFRLAIRRTV